MKNVTIITLACVGVLGTMLPNANASRWNEETTFTFNEPVEIPGQVLDPGTYVFRLVGTMADRDIVKVFNQDQTHLYGTFLTVPYYSLKRPDYRFPETGKTTITFDERGAGSPDAVKAWFYPGDAFGHEFVYGRGVGQGSQTAGCIQAGCTGPNATKSGETMQDPQVVAMKRTPRKARQPVEEQNRDR